MNNWQRKISPYEGDEAYLYLAFAEKDAAKLWPILRSLLERGCRVWYCCGPAGSAEELLRRQERSTGAALTVLYLTDAACADKDTKSNLLVNQKHSRPILVLDPDGVDRRLSMGLRETVPSIPLYQLRGSGELESAILHADGFSQEMFGEPVSLPGKGLAEKLTKVFCLLAALLAIVSFVGARYLHWFQPSARDEIVFDDPAISASVGVAARGGAVTKELANKITVLQMKELPESWEDLSRLPALETILLPQELALHADNLPDGYTLVLIGGERP